MKWTRAKIAKLSHKKGPKHWKDRMAIEYAAVANLHASANAMNRCETNAQDRVALLDDYKAYLLLKALDDL